MCEKLFKDGLLKEVSVTGRVNLLKDLGTVEKLYRGKNRVAWQARSKITSEKLLKITQRIAMCKSNKIY